MYHTTTEPNRKSRGTLDSCHILSQYSSPTAHPSTFLHNPTPSPLSQPPRLLAGVIILPVNRTFPAQVILGMFNLREVQMCLTKSKWVPLVCWVSWSFWRISLRGRKENLKTKYFFFFFFYFLLGSMVWVCLCQATDTIKTVRVLTKGDTELCHRLLSWR